LHATFSALRAVCIIGDRARHAKLELGVQLLGGSKKIALFENKARTNIRPKQLVMRLSISLY
jgi:hypothetical protein